MISRVIVLVGICGITGFLHADSLNYAYDDAGRLTSVSYPGGTVITYTYDAAGNLTARTVTGGSGMSAKRAKPDTHKTKADGTAPSKSGNGKH